MADFEEPGAANDTAPQRPPTPPAPPTPPDAGPSQPPPPQYPAQRSQPPPPQHAPQPPQPPPPQYAPQPGYGQPSPGFGAPNAPYGQGAPYAQGFAQRPAKGPRPRVPVAAALMLLGAAVAILGTFLPWASNSAASVNGYDEFFWFSDTGSRELSNPGFFVVFGAVIMIGLGVATLAAGRVLAVTVIGICSAAFGILGGGILLILMADFADFAGADLGIGAIIQPVAPIISLVGAIMATARKRRPVDGAPT